MIGLKQGDKLTYFSVNSMAMSVSRKITVVRETKTHIIFKVARKRKLYQIAKKDIYLLFKGHELPFDTQMELSNVWWMNACLNLVSPNDLPMEKVREYIEEKNLITPTQHQKAHFLYYTFEQANSSEYQPGLENCMYPEAENASVLIQGIRKNTVDEPQK